MEKERAKSHLAGSKSKKKSKKRVSRVHIRRSANDGYIAENLHEIESPGMMAHPNEEHTYPDLAGVQGHLAEHLGQGPESAGEEQEEAEGRKRPMMPMPAEPTNA